MKKYLLLILILGLTGCSLQPPFGGDIDEISKDKLKAKYDVSEIKDKYELVGSSLKRKMKNDPKDMIRIELGNENADEFIPRLKVSRWDEVYFTLAPEGLDKIARKDKKLKFDKEKTIFETPKVDYHLYDASEEHSEGAYEYEIILKEKPGSNVIEFTLDSEGLNFYYQPELTQEEKDKGAFSPENVIGSYAVYASEQKINLVGGKEYKIGKMGHIYRVDVHDTNGDWVWTDLNIENGLLTITIPQDFLDTAVYPVDVGQLTFGFTSAGGAGNYWSAEYGSQGIFGTGDMHTAVTGDTIVKYSVHHNNTNAGSWDFSAYTFSGGVPVNRLAAGVTITVGSSVTWYHSGAISQAMSNGVTYGIGIGNMTGSQVRISYDNVGGYHNSVDEGHNLPAVWTESENSGVKYSVYATYTAAPADPCAYEGSGDWEVLYSDNCYITSDVYVNGEFNLIYDGAGSFGTENQISATRHNIDNSNLIKRDCKNGIDCFVGRH